MIITNAYFNINTELPHISESVPSPSLVGNNSELESFKQRYEKEVLLKILSFPLYKAFMSAFDYNEDTNTHTIKSDADQKWKDLLNGKEYTKNGIEVFWPGIIYDDENVKRSFIANYIYCMFLKKDASKHLGVGLVIPKAKNAQRAEPKHKFTTAYNEFVDLVVGNYSDGYSNDLGNGIRSMYEFINDMNALNSNTYPNWMPETFGHVNIFSL